MRILEFILALQVTLLQGAGSYFDKDTGIYLDKGFCRYFDTGYCR
jgi:hypothetical protein